VLNITKKQFLPEQHMLAAGGYYLCEPLQKLLMNYQHILFVKLRLIPKLLVKYYQQILILCNKIFIFLVIFYYPTVHLHSR